MAATTETRGTATGAGAATGARAGWALGPASGLVIIGGMVLTGAGFSVTDELPVDTMIDKLVAAKSALLLGGALQAVVAMTLVVFGAWVAARLRSVQPSGSSLAGTAFGGFGLSAALAASAGAHTQLIATDADRMVDPAIALTLHTLEENLFAAAFCVLAVAAAALAVAGLRHRVVPAWLGGVSAFITVLLVVLQLVVPWAGWFPAAIWLVAAGIGLRSVGRGTPA